MRFISTSLVSLFLALAPLSAEEEFKPRQVVKPFKAIVNAPHVKLDRAGEFVQDNELVLGVSIGKESRAYPINMLTNPTREIINDKLGGKNIAATW